MKKPTFRTDWINGCTRVFVTDAATGRILFTREPLASEKGDRSFVDRLRLLLTPCS